MAERWYAQIVVEWKEETGSHWVGPAVIDGKSWSAFHLERGVYGVDFKDELTEKDRTELRKLGAKPEAEGKPNPGVSIKEIAAHA